ncbi:MAG TPA: electron transport complex subunit RsxC [Marinagarivorans sp.]
MRKIWEVPGGVHPPENKAQSLQHPIATAALVDEYVLPLAQHIGAPSTPVVEVGDAVKKYQRLADTEGVFSAALHAPTSGVVTAIEDRFIAHPSGLSAPCIVIKADGLDTALALSEAPNPFELEHATLIEKIRSAGLVGLGGAGFPTAVKLNPRSNTVINTLILNGTECEPYITADDALMQAHADEVILGAQLLAHTLGNPAQVLIGVEDNKPKAIAALEGAAKGSDIEVVSFPTKYPSGGEKQLIYILTGKEVTSGQIPASLGIVVQNVGTAVAAWRAVRYGEPLIERITTVVGESLKTQRNMRVRIGTPMDRVLEENGFNPASSARLIVGGPMMGFALEQTSVPVVKTTNCILAPSHTEMPEAPAQQACIRCGHCAEACPAGLLPQQLYWYARADEHEKLQNHNLFDCIECGACSYVCPSAIPLVQYYRSAKGTIRQAQEDKLKSDRARERFERRQARIAKEEAAKEAKRQARKLAAEQNKAKQANASAGATPEETMATKATVAAKAQNNPEQDKARIERTLASLNARMERLNSQIAEASENQQPVEKLTSQLKQTQIKLQDARAKLAALKQTQASQNSSASQDSGAQNASAATAKSDDPVAIAEKNLASISKRLATAREKLAEAIEAGKPTINALKQGVEKLEIKVDEARHALEATKALPAELAVEPATTDAAAAAIAKAQAKAKAAAAMSLEEKRAANIASLEKRLAKAKSRLHKAEQDNDDNIAAFAAGVEKLEQKLQDAMNEGTQESTT